MSATIPLVQSLGKEHVTEIVSVLCDAFADYPVMRYVLGEKDYPRRLNRLVEFFVRARLLRHEPLLGIFQGSGLCAAALVSYPAASATSSELAALRAATWQDLGSDAEERYASYKEIAGRFAVAVPNIHLNVIGVRLLMK